jgi:hypothetical protein
VKINKMIQINWFTQSLKNHTGYDIYMESGEEKRGLKKINTSAGDGHKPGLR